jgi:signal transduction histidine kinase
MIAKRSIKTRLTGVVSILVILIILAISYFTLTHFEVSTRELISEEQYARVELFADEIDGKLRDMQDLLIILSGKASPDIFRNRARARMFLDQHAELQKLFDGGLFLFNHDGIMIAEAPLTTTRVGRSFAFREYMTATLSTRKPYISEPYFSAVPDSHPSIMFTIPVTGADGRVLGLLGGSIDLLKADVISRLIRAPAGKTGYFYVITRDRRILLHPDRSRILQQDVPAGSNSLLEKAIEGFEGTGETVTSKGLRSITSFKSLKVKNWLVAANYPVKEAYLHLYQARDALLFIVIITALFVPLVVWYVMNVLTGPLLSFTKHVDAMHEKQGEERIVRVLSEDEIGKLAGAFNRMVADLDRRQAEIESRKEEVERLLGEIGEFNREIETLLAERTMSLMALTVADKIKNPAALIGGITARLSAKGDMSEALMENFAVIAESAKNIEKIVNDFQSLLKSRQSKFSYEDINEAVKKVFSALAGHADEKGIRFVVNLAPQRMMVNIQLSLLRIAIFHLIKNAIEATPEGGVVSVSTLPEGDRVEIIISDTGPGIPPDIIDRIFDPFFTTKGKSFGMGLPLVKQVVSEHMGKITVESEDGKGATFRISLPERWKEA